MRHHHLSIASCLALCLSSCLAARSSTTHRDQQAPRAAAAPTGPWHAWLDCPGGALPFQLQFGRREGRPTAAIHNGAERLEVPVVRFAAGRLTLGIDHYDSEIVATLGRSGTRLDGHWRKRRGGDRVTRLAFHATRGARPRFPAPEPAAHRALRQRFAALVEELLGKHP